MKDTPQLLNFLYTSSFNMNTMLVLMTEKWGGGKMFKVISNEHLTVKGWKTDDISLWTFNCGAWHPNSFFCILCCSHSWPDVAISLFSCLSPTSPTLDHIFPLMLPFREPWQGRQECGGTTKENKNIKSTEKNFKHESIAVINSGRTDTALGCFKAP